MNQDKLNTVVTILKGAILYAQLLNDWERQFAQSVAFDYSRFGAKLSLTDKQISTLFEIRRKLGE